MYLNAYQRLKDCCWLGLWTDPAMGTYKTC